MQDDVPYHACRIPSFFQSFRCSGLQKPGRDRIVHRRRQLGLESGQNRFCAVHTEPEGVNSATAMYFAGV